MQLIVKVSDEQAQKELARAKNIQILMRQVLDIFEKHPNRSFSGVFNGIPVRVNRLNGKNVCQVNGVDLV